MRSELDGSQGAPGFVVRLEQAKQLSSFAGRGIRKGARVDGVDGASSRSRKRVALAARENQVEPVADVSGEASAASRLEFGQERPKTHPSIESCGDRTPGSQHLDLPD